jgi:O-antigen ligase
MVITAQIDRHQKYLAHGLGLLVFLPFAYYRGSYPITSFFGEWLALLIGLVVGIVLLCNLKRQFLYLPYVILLPLGLAVLIGLQLMLNPLMVKGFAQTGMLYLLWTALVMIVAQQGVKEFGAVKMADYLACYLLVGGLWNALSEFNHLENSELLGLGTIGQSNQLCDYLFLSCCSLIYLYAKQWVGFRIMVISLVLLTADMVLSSSRSAVLYLVVGGCLIGLWRNTDNQADFKRLHDSYLMFVLFCIVWQIIFPFLGLPSIMGRLVKAAADGVPSARLFFWKDALAIWRDSPWLGAGLGEFDWAFFMHGKGHDHSVINNRVEHAHNLIFHVLAEMGLVGALWLIITGGLWLRRAIPRGHDLLGWWHLTLLSILVVHSLLEYPLWLADFLGVFAIMLAIAETRSFCLRLSSVMRGALCLIPAVGLFLLVSTGLSYLTMEKFYEATAQSQPLPADLQQMVSLSNSGLLAPFGLKYFAFNFKMDSDQAIEKAGITAKALHFEPIPPLAYKQAVYLAYVGKHDESEELFRLAVTSYPHEYAWFLAQVEALNQADKDKLAFLFANKSE